MCVSSPAVSAACDYGGSTSSGPVAVIGTVSTVSWCEVACECADCVRSCALAPGWSVCVVDIVWVVWMSVISAGVGALASDVTWSVVGMACNWLTCEVSCCVGVCACEGVGPVWVSGESGSPLLAVSCSTVSGECLGCSD